MINRQHNPAAGDGPEPFIVFVREFAKAFPSMRFDFKRQVAEKDLVVMHSHLIRQQPLTRTRCSDHVVNST
ncbi:MAG TPA: hypothetical protein VJJ51_03185 [Candidatus Methanoperedens sp.]|nr:hypothetical protein [Candidatus Methanoperedens sp.]HLB70026.1 hypothetical protein [Candidatus Methanoperedens sp.]